jgi:hypothetical protein
MLAFVFFILSLGGAEVDRGSVASAGGEAFK